MSTDKNIKQGLRFFYDPQRVKLISLFDELFELFREIIGMTGGNVNEAISWLNEVDRQYKISNKQYGIADFIKDLEEKGFLKRDSNGPSLKPSSKMDASIRQSAFDSIFGKIRKSGSGNHNTSLEGRGAESLENSKTYEFGDPFNRIDATESLKNAYINHGIDDLRLDENDLIIKESIQQSPCSTVLMIDVSHSMILYGEDRITPAKKVALALSQFIRTKYPKDSLDIIVFGDDAWQIELKDLPYLQVGPFHTNTIAGLELAVQLLQKRKNPNKNIMMITDGKPTCMKRGKEYYKNSFGLDRQIINRTLHMGSRCNKLGIDVTTFMVATDPYLVEFVEQFSTIARGKAFYTHLDNLGSEIFINYEKNRKKSK
ncbi:MAG: VWA domain-containing protein [Saprospiraceae bacterium]|nr:VWA domain-containing protein [Saprospiraceae bacterium]